jgi:DNA-binding CsgD family transcriptional regulator
MAETEASAVLDRPTTDDGVPLADRGDSLEQFEAIFLGREPTHGGCLSIEGGWGMGRTSLLNAACLTAQRAGCVVLRVAGAKQKHSTSFGVLLRIVESIYPLRPANDEITGRIETVLALIERNGERGFGTLGPAFYELLLATRHIGPVLLAIDDANLVDDATMSTLEYLYERVDDQPIWLLTTSPSRRPGVAPLAIDELLVRHNVRHMALTPLERDGIREVLATQLSVEPDDGFVDTVLEATGGRPEFVVQLARALRSEGLGSDTSSLRKFDQLPIPRISHQVLTRVNALSPSVRHVLEACAVWGATDDLASVQHFAAVRADLFERALEHLRHAELLSPGRSLAFVAPVVQWALLQEIAPERRSELHARCAEELERTGARDADVVRHLLATETAWSTDVARKLCVAGRRLFEQGEVELAAKCQWRLLNEGQFGEPAWSLWLDVAKCEAALGLRTSLASFQRALALGANDEDRVLTVALSLMDRLRDWPDVRAVGVATLQSLSRHFGAVDPTSRLQFELGLTLLAGHPAQRNYDVTRIEGIVASSDEESGTGDLARLFLDVLGYEKDPTVTSVDVAERFGAVFVTNGIPIGDFSGKVILMRTCRLLLHADQFAIVDEFLEVTRRRAYSAGDAALEGDALRLTVLSKLWQGSLDEADDAVRRLDAMDNSYSERHVVGSLDLLVAHDRNDEALRRLSMTEPKRIVDPLECAQAHVERGRLFAAVGRADDALGEYRRAKAVTERAGLTNEVLVAWRPGMARTLASLGRWEEAQAMARDHFAAARTFGSRRTLGTARRAMADVTRDSYERFTWLTEALTFLEESQSQLEAAGVMIDLGALLLERRNGEDARPLLEQGLALASACKSELLVKAATSHLSPSAARARPAQVTGVASLTPAELRAVTLASANATNRDIADQLYVNLKTIEGHLSRAYRKLGITSRFEIEDAMSGPVDDT